jgi:hypothetical protein
MAVTHIDTPFQTHNGLSRGVDIRKVVANLLLKDSSDKTHIDQLGIWHLRYAYTNTLAMALAT